MLEFVTCAQSAPTSICVINVNRKGYILNTLCLRSEKVIRRLLILFANTLRHLLTNRNCCRVHKRLTSRTSLWVATFSQKFKTKINLAIKVALLRKALVTSTKFNLVRFLQSNGLIATMVRFHGQLTSFLFNQVVTIWMLRPYKLIAKFNQAKLTYGKSLCRLLRMLVDTLLILECRQATTSDLVKKFGVISKSLINLSI